jgi:hypothetical protein
MAIEIFLINYENVEPDVLPALALRDALVILFVDAHPSDLPSNLVDILQELKGNGRYIRAKRASENNLDMHLVCYMEDLLKNLPDAFFNIISKDHNIDSLLRHINTVANRAARWTNLNDAVMGKHSSIVYTPKEKVCKISSIKTKIRQSL